MKRVFIPLLTVAVVVGIVFAGCVGAPAPPVTPVEPVTPVTPVTPVEPVTPPEAPLKVKDLSEYQDLIAKGIIDPELPINPYEGLAIKPDGTPYKFAIAHAYSGCDVTRTWERMITSLTERAGAETTLHVADWDLDGQIGFIEDQITIGQIDALFIFAVTEDALVPSVDKLVAGGISVFAYDIDIPNPKITTFVHHDFDGDTGQPYGTNVVADYFVGAARDTGKHIYLFEVWGSKAMATSHERNRGLHAVLDQYPDLVTVMESADSDWRNEITADLVIDAFTAHPELNACYHHGGGGTGAIEGLRSVGRLLPVGNPDRVLICNNDLDTAGVEAMDAEQMDACGTHGAWDFSDTLVKCCFWNVILGEPVPARIHLPMFLVTRENIDSFAMYGVPAAYPRLPGGQFDIWPVADTSEDFLGLDYGLETPTMADRMELLGY